MVDIEKDDYGRKQGRDVKLSEAEVRGGRNVACRVSGGRDETASVYGFSHRRRHLFA